MCKIYVIFFFKYGPNKQARGENKIKFLERKKYIQRRFKIEMGINVDKPRAGGAGTSSNGNVARKFYCKCRKSMWAYRSWSYRSLSLCINSSSPGIRMSDKRVRIRQVLHWNSSNTRQIIPVVLLASKYPQNIDPWICCCKPLSCSNLNLFQGLKEVHTSI